MKHWLQKFLFFSLVLALIIGGVVSAYALPTVSINLSETTISPNGDGFRDTMVVWFNISTASRVTVRVLNPAGGVVTNLHRNANLTAGPHAFVWGGTRGLTGGGVLPNGRYQMQVVATDSTGTNWNQQTFYIMSDLISTGRIENGAVTRDKLAAGAVTGASIADGSITLADLAALTVLSANIADGAVTGAKVADGTLTGADIQDGSITGNGDLAAETITGANIKDGSLGTSDLADGAVTSDKLAAEAVGAAELGPDSIDGSNVVDESLTGDDILDGSITGNGDIAADTITAANIAADAVGASELADGSVVGGLGGDVADNSLTFDDLADNSVTTAELADGAVTIAKLDPAYLALVDAAFVNDGAGEVDQVDFPNAVINPAVPGVRVVSGTVGPLPVDGSVNPVGPVPIDTTGIFGATPSVLLTFNTIGDYGTTILSGLETSGTTSTGFEIWYVVNAPGALGSTTFVNWLAIGP